MTILVTATQQSIDPLKFLSQILTSPQPAFFHYRAGKQVLLKKRGFTPQKPLRRAYERDPAAVQQWLDEDYPGISRQAKRKHAEIHWGDEMGSRSDHPTGTSNGRRGHTPVIPGMGQQFRCNMISTITNRGTRCCMVFTARFTADVMLEFPRRLLRHAKRKVFLIVDGHPVHRSARVKQWIEKLDDNI